MSEFLKEHNGNGSSSIKFKKYLTKIKLILICY